MNEIESNFFRSKRPKIIKPLLLEETNQDVFLNELSTQRFNIFADAINFLYLKDSIEVVVCRKQAFVQIAQIRTLY